MSNTICEKCGIKFSNKYTLDRHKKNSDCFSPEKKLKCNICDYRTNRKDHLKKHEETCKMPKGKTAKRNTLKGLPCDGTPLTLEFVQQHLEEFTYEMFCQGIHGIVRFIRNILENETNYILRDFSRLKFVRLTEEGIWEYDQDAYYLVNLVFQVLKIKYGQYYDKMHAINEKEPELASIIDDKVRLVLYVIEHEESEAREIIIKKIALKLKKTVKRN